VTNWLSSSLISPFIHTWTSALKNATKAIVLVTAILGAICPVAAAQSNAPQDLLLTRQGVEIGGQLAHYHYKEPGLIDITGNRAGVVGVFTFVNPAQRLFTRIDVRGSYGSLKYEGSGTINGVPDWIAEARIVSGKDFLPGSGVSLSPYAGLGYRFLFNDLRGYSSSGAVGYRRYSNYSYAPIGLTSRISISEQWVLAPTLEYDAFIHGQQISKLSDAGLGDPDVTNTQNGGFGYRVSIMAETGHWAFGPWLHYWHIRDSDLQRINATTLGLEPANWTREVGFELRYRF
jgi:hypothetical protein